MTKKVLIFVSLSVFILIIVFNIYSFPGGYVGVTNKGGEGIGCICHGTHAPTPSVTVFFSGPDSVETGHTETYTIHLVHGPAVTGGFDAAVYAGLIDTIYTETGVRRDSATGDLTHNHPKVFTDDSVSWSFKYTAPQTAQVDTLYAVANSTNNDSTSDNDEWNFSPNFTIRVYNPIGIKNQNTIAAEFRLDQNYPNPFNPSTNIKYNLNKEGFVKLEVFDMTGKSISILASGMEHSGEHVINFDSKNLASGVYFYRLDFFDKGNITESNVKKMIILK